MKVKKIALVVILLVLVGLSTVCVIINSKKLSFDYDESMEVSLNQELNNLDNIKNLKNGTILTEEETIDTSALGDQEIKVEIKDVFGNVKEYSYIVSVRDDESPVIIFEKVLETEEGTEIDLLKDVKVTDNSLEEITPIVEGEYDFLKVGEYTLYYVAEDSSHNVTREEFTLKVKEKKQEEVPSNSNNTNSNTNPIDKPNINSGSNNHGNTNNSESNINNGNSNNSSNSNTSSATVDTTFTTSKGFKGVVKDGVTYIDGYLIANKTYSLPSSYGKGLTSETNNYFYKMKSAAALDGLNIYISSGFRSYATQNQLYNNYVKMDGKVAADTYSARAGHSEHQTGLAFDVNIINDSFANTPEAKWLANNCYKYGFILRYPKGKSNETGYKYEPWHFRYVGVDLATKLYNNGDWLTMEDYFGITSVYQ